MVFAFEIGLIILFSILGGVLAVRFRQPSVLGLILIGALVGPNTFGFITDNSLINSSIEIGSILLLFTVGIEFSLQKLLNHGIRVILIAVLKLGVVFLVSYYAALFLGLGPIVSLYAGVILSITSTVIVIKIIDQKGFAKREEISLLIAILIIEDIFAVFALTFFSSLNTSLDLRPVNLLTTLVVSLTLMILVYIVLQRLLKPIIKWLIKYSTDDTITFISLGLCGGMSYFALLLNLSPSVGAFLAGNIVASLPNSDAFQRAIHPFILTFTSLFFFSLGTLVNLSAIISSLGIVIVLFLVNIISKFFIIGFGSYLFTNFNGKQAVFSGIAMLSVGEFSLLIAKESNTLGLGIDLVSITAALIVLSSFGMSALLTSTEKIYTLISKMVPDRVKEDITLSSKFLNNLSWRMLIDKANTKRIVFEWKSIVNNLMAVFIILASVFFLFRFFSPFVRSFLSSNILTYAISLLVFFAVFFPTFKMTRNTLHLIKDIFSFFVKIYPSEIANERKIFRNILIVSFLFVALIILPGSSILFHIGFWYHITVILLLMGFLFYAFRTSHLIHSVTKKHEKAFDNFSKKYKLLLKKRIKYGDEK